MALYIELMPIEGSSNRGRGDGLSRRAGTSNVRRPFRGIEVKEDTFAFFRVLKSDGTPLEMVDSSSKSGQSSTYANFILQSVTEQRMERQQILETFGPPLVFFFGEAPRFVNISAVVLDTNDFNWHAEWWENYEKYLRGTRLAERGSTALLHYDDTILEGYPTQCTASRGADNRNMVQIQMQMFVTNYINVSNIGDVLFPLREGSELPDLVRREDNTYTPTTQETIQETNRKALLAYLQRTAVQNIQLQIMRARTIERARELQKQAALEQLGVETQGVDLISLGKSILQGAYTNLRDGNAKGSQQVIDELGEQTRKALGLAKEGKTMEAINLLRRGDTKTGVRALGSALLESVRPGPITLQEALRNALLYSSPSPAADLNSFLERLRQLPSLRGWAEQQVQIKRELPYRSKIWDNYDEYTQRGEGEDAINAFETRTGTFSGNPQPQVPNLGKSVAKYLQNVGVKPTAREMKSLGLFSWQPNQRAPGEHIFGLNDFARGVNGLLDLTHAKGSYRIPVSNDNQHTFHKQWGSTPDVGGSYGGMLGGSGGSGIAGKAVQLKDFFQFGSGLPQSSPWGVPGQPPYAYTDGFGPTGEPLYTKKFSYGSKEGGSFLGGGVNISDAQNKGSSQQGKGFFSMVVLESST